MMKPRLLSNGRLPPGLLARLAAAYALTTLGEQADPAAHLAEHGAAYEGPVSYTHLDVYKRQPTRRSAARTCWPWA